MRGRSRNILLQNYVSEACGRYFFGGIVQFQYVTTENVQVQEGSMPDVIKHYSTEEVTVVWQPEKCIHSAHCFRNLPSVFNPRVKPWVQPENAEAAELITVVRGCPSGALSIANGPGATGE